MRTTRLASLLLLGVLLIGLGPVAAEEKSSGVNSSLSGSTISGYVNSSAQWQASSQAMTRVRVRNFWLGRFLGWFRLYRVD